MKTQQKIRLLPPHEALRIAAGEVIERPAHVIKELIENSLDAQATTIDIRIKNFGKELIQVVDNGLGMNYDDARLCFLAHATSKINSLDDLESVQTFGFRGEALASISAISKVKLITKSDHAAFDDLAIQLVYAQSNVISESFVSAPQGTDVSVEDLFFNTPVRKKFLKQDETEWNAIQQIVHAFCLGYPNVHFRLYRDNKIILNAPSIATIKDRAFQLWDSETSSSLIPLLDYSRNEKMQSLPCNITGLISHHNFWRYGRQYIHFFVNRRWIKNTELGKGLLQGYLNVLPQGRFPAGLIFIEIKSDCIDVNVHPKKEEVKFIRPGVIQTTLAMTVKKTLEGHLTKSLNHLDSIATQTVQKISPDIQASSSHNNSHNQRKYTNQSMQICQLEEERNPFFLDGAHRAKQELSKESEKSAPKLDAVQLDAIFSFKALQEKTSSQTQESLAPSSKPWSDTIIGQIFNTYILLEQKDEIIFVDQHAAHERILYEKHQAHFENQHGTTLIFPEILTLEHEQITWILEHKPFFQKQGIDFDSLGIQQIVVRTAPQQLRGSSLKDFLMDAVLFIQEHQSLEPSLFGKEFNQHLHAQMACKGAIKAGDVLSKEQMQQLITDLQLVENRFICAHGRPTTWSIAKSMFEKQFKRC